MWVSRCDLGSAVVVEEVVGVSLARMYMALETCLQSVVGIHEA